MKSFIYLQDPRHGWLIVSREDLKAVGLKTSDFSAYTYASGDTLALEEDCDAGVFLNRLKELGIAFELREQHVSGDAYVRSWRPVWRAA